MEKILILGGGPAGCVSALHLTRLGYHVDLVTEERSAEFVEGLSARVVEGLTSAGCERAVDYLQAPVPRISSWNGATSAANTEQILNRKDFDAALLADARAAGVSITIGQAQEVQAGPNGCRVQVVTSSGARRAMHGRYLLEARGRRAPRARAVAMRGQPGFALSRRFENCPDLPSGTWVASFPEGWAWFAGTDRAAGTLQIVVDGTQGSLAPLPKLADMFSGLVGQIPEVRPCLGDNARAVGPIIVRECTPFLHSEPIIDGVVRVGDASFGADNLSGHGIFEAVGAGMAIAPVLNTILQRPQDTALAQGFYETRARNAFLGHARVGRDFYRSEERWSDRPFWRNRCSWPDDEPAHPMPSNDVPRVQILPVIENDFIERREVVITANQARGVRFVDGTPLVPLIDLIGELGRLPDNEAAGRHLGRRLDDCTIALDWLRAQNILGPEGLTVSASQLRDNGSFH